MKLTKLLVDRISRLESGASVASSQLKGEWVDEFLKEGLLVAVNHGSRKSYRAPRPDLLRAALVRYNEAFSSPGLAVRILGTESSRSDQARESGNSKIINRRTCPGFLVNTFEPVVCNLHGADFILSPPEGSFVFVSEWEHFTIPADALVIGIENMENFRMIRQQRTLFETQLIQGEKSMVFVSRYPQSASLRSWLEIIPNRYVHFGDFDLAGISIYLTEFHRYLSARCSFLIPDDIEMRLRSGSRRRYDDQYARFSTLVPGSVDGDSRLAALVRIIHRYRRCYDQEGYIGR